MSTSGEFEMIGKFFTFTPKVNGWTSTGVGDDCAIIDLEHEKIAVTTDMMALTTHFLPDCNPEHVGWKAIAVNLSDLAAAGAIPKAVFLAIGLPERDDKWLEGFSLGMRKILDRYNVSLLGGDTTRTPEVSPGVHSPVEIAITAIGELPKEAHIKRSGAQVGDDIWVSGTPGDAYAGLMNKLGKWEVEECHKEYFSEKMELPIPRVELGIELLGVASAAADISDGLLQDLGHILERSMVAATLNIDSLPFSVALASLGVEKAREASLVGGDDYELVFTAPNALEGTVKGISKLTGVRLTKIGTITQKVTDKTFAKLSLVDDKGNTVNFTKPGFDHFKC